MPRGLFSEGPRVEISLGLDPHILAGRGQLLAIHDLHSFVQGINEISAGAEVLRQGYSIRNESLGEFVKAGCPCLFAVANRIFVEEGSDSDA